MNNQLEELRTMLTERGVPFESYSVEWKDSETLNAMIDMFGEIGRYRLNQIVYGRYEDGNGWKFDAVLQAGSYHCRDGLIETYGDLGTDKHGAPMVMTADKALEIILTDWEKQRSDINGT